MQLLRSNECCRTPIGNLLNDAEELVLAATIDVPCMGLRRIVGGDRSGALLDCHQLQRSPGYRLCWASHESLDIPVATFLVLDFNRWHRAFDHRARSRMLGRPLPIGSTQSGAVSARAECRHESVSDAPNAAMIGR